MKSSTLASWKRKHEWLTIENDNLYCKWCTKYEKRISSVKVFSRKFIEGIKAQKYSRITEHEQGEPHKAAKRGKEQDEAKERGDAYRGEIPTDAPILQGVKRMRDTEAQGLQKLFDVAYYVASKGRPLSDFKSLIELEKLHGVNFHGTSYETRTACSDFLLSISDYLFEKEVKKKISRTNFITIMTDGTTDAGILKQEVIYRLYLDPDVFEPQMAFFYLKELHGGQGADILKKAIEDAFVDNDMEEARQKIVFFGSDGTATNSGLNAGLITKLKQDFAWIAFIWCLSHRLELAMKDSLKDFMGSVDNSLRHLYYMYKNSSKKLSQLKSLFESLGEVYDFESKSIKPEKSIGTRWLDHKVRAMTKLNDKFGVYAKQIQSAIEEKSSSTDNAILQGKLNALTTADVLLRSAFLADILEPAKILSLVSQQESGDIITTTDSVKRSREKYERWYKRFSTNPEKVFELPTLKRILSQIDLETYSYQGIKLKYFERQKQYIQDDAASIVERIIHCFNNRFGILDGSSDNVAAEVKEGDNILFHICRIINSKVLPTEVSEDSLCLQIESLTFLYEHFKKIPLLEGSNLIDVIDGYIDMSTQWTEKNFGRMYSD